MVRLYSKVHTDDGFETTLTVVDPTADRTITFPNETGTTNVHTTGGTTTHTAIVVADGGNIGSIQIQTLLL